MFEAQVRRSPEAPAVELADERVSYRELNRRANRLAHHLRASGMGAGRRAGICLERSVDMVVAVLGVGLWNAALAVGIAGIPRFARIVRATALSLVTREYIEGARAVGARPGRILFRHVLPNLAPTLIVLGSLDLGNAVLFTATLSFLGLGAQPPTPEWGTMLADGRQFMMTSPHVAAIPGFAVLALVWGLNMLGDGLRDLLDPTLAHATR